MTTPSTTTPDRKRRGFLKGAGLAAAAGAVASPAVAQAMPEIRWRLTSSFPRQLDTIFGTAQTFAKLHGRGDRQQVPDPDLRRRASSSAACRPWMRCRAAPSSAARPRSISISARSRPSASAPACRSASMPASSIPGGISAAARRSSTSIFARFNCVGHRHAASRAARWAASSARSSRPSTICSGLKFRIGGLGGQVLAKLGVMPQQIAAGDVYPALERGTIDAAEFVGPYDDEKLGLSEGREILLRARLVGGRRDAPPPRQPAEMGRAAEELPGDRHAGLRGGEQLDAGEIRCRERPGAAPHGRRGHRAAPVPASHHGGVAQGRERALRRAVREEPGLQAAPTNSMVAFRADVLPWWQVNEFQYDAFMVRTRGRS